MKLDIDALFEKVGMVFLLMAAAGVSLVFIGLGILVIRLALGAI
jgi:hypothetical protein